MVTILVYLLKTVPLYDCCFHITINNAPSLSEFEYDHPRYILRIFPKKFLDYLVVSPLLSSVCFQSKDPKPCLYQCAKMQRWPQNSEIPQAALGLQWSQGLLKTHVNYRKSFWGPVWSDGSGDFKATHPLAGTIHGIVTWQRYHHDTFWCIFWDWLHLTCPIRIR